MRSQVSVPPRTLLFCFLFRVEFSCSTRREGMVMPTDHLHSIPLITHMCFQGKSQPQPAAHAFPCVCLYNRKVRLSQRGISPVLVPRGWNVAMDHSSRDTSAGLGAALRVRRCCPQKQEMKMEPTKASHVPQCKRTKETAREESEASFSIVMFKMPIDTMNRAGVMDRVTQVTHEATSITKLWSQ
jgi:hypothetical protein